MKVAYSLEELPRLPRAVAIGTFDGVHLGHRRAVETAAANRLPVTAVVVTEAEAPVLTTVGRRLELLGALAVDEALVVEEEREFDLEALGAAVVVAADDGQLARSIRAAIERGDVVAAARRLGRPWELDGVVVTGDARGAGLGFPTANLALADELAIPAYGIYAGAAEGHRAAISVGVNPHYRGDALRVEAFLLDFEGDLYGRRLLVELWRRLRDERSFTDEAELVAQIVRDVEQTRSAVKPV